MNTNKNTTDIRIENWKRLLKRMHLDRIRMKSESFFLASGGYESLLAPAYDDKDNKGLAKCIALLLSSCGFKVEMLNQQRVKIHDVPRYSISEKRIQSIGKRAEVIAPGEPGGVEIVASTRREKILIKVQATSQRGSNSAEHASKGSVYTAENFPDFLVWFADRFPILFATCPTV